MKIQIRPFLIGTLLGLVVLFTRATPAAAFYFPFSLPSLQELLRLNPLARIISPIRPIPTIRPLIRIKETPSPTPTGISAPTQTPTVTPSPTPTPTLTSTPTPTQTPTPTLIPTLTLTPTPTESIEETPTPTPQETPTPSVTPTATPSLTETPTPTPSSTPTPTETPTPTAPQPTIPAGMSALQFSDQQEVNIPDSASLDTATSSATWEMWFKPNSVGGENVILSRWSAEGMSWKIYLYNVAGENYISAYLYAPSTGNAYISQPLPDLGNWHHIAFVYDGTAGTNEEKLKAYVDGQPKSIFVNGSSPVLPSTLNPVSSIPVKIGASVDGGYFDGVIDEVRIWNISRSASDIQNNYQKELTGSESGLVGYWKFNEGSGTVAFDSTANLNNGSLINNPTWINGYPQVVLNEFMPKPGDNYDWVELYNPSGVDIDISGWQLSDIAGIFKTFSPGTTLNSGNFTVVTDYQRLDNGGDTIYLQNAAGYEADSKTYSSSDVETDKSIGRNPDGSGGWKKCNDPSRDSSNNPSC